jgi:hypothetical protein
MNQYIPGYNLLKIKITPKAIFNRAKIIDVRKYHNSFINVNKRIVKFFITLLSYKIKIVKKRIVKFLLRTTAPRVSKMILSPKKL